MRVVFALLANLLTLLFWPFLAWRARRGVPQGAFIEVEIDGALVELERPRPFWARKKQVFALHSLRRTIDALAQDPKVAGLCVKIASLRAGSATATALRNLLLAARAVGKRVIVYLPDGGGTRDTFVASAADGFVVGPETFLAPLGFAVETPYLRAALDRVGVEPEVFARGRYKTAGESLQLTRMSEAQREQLGALLDVAWDVLLDALASGRSVDREQARAWVEGGPWSADAAREQRLVDHVAYDDELPKWLAPTLEEGAPFVTMKRYLRLRAPRFRPLVRKPAIAVIEIKGPIVSEHVGIAPVAAEDEVCGAVDRARESRRHRAAVLCIDSPGGSALASDRMLHAIRRLAETKPVIACMGDTAASGGYMVAMGAALVFAQPTTITGSIGVVSARMIVEPLLEKLGVDIEVVKRGERADMMSSVRRLEPGERDAFERQLDDIYRSFLAVVAKGRSREVADIEPLAGGRVWSGRDALAHGLVDRAGGFAQALDEARQRLGPRAAGLEPELVSAAHWPARRGLVPRLLSLRSPFGNSLAAWWPALALALSPRQCAYLFCSLVETDLGR